MSNPKPIGEVLAGQPTLEKRPAPCPGGCGNESIEVRYAPPANMSEQLRARLNAERPFVPRLCPACQAAKEADARRQQLAAEIELAVKSLEVPPLYAGVTLDNFDLSDDPEGKLLRAATYARNYVATWPDVPLITVFTGGCGTGKGHLAWSIAKEVAATHGVHGRVHVLSDVIRDLREAWNATDDGPSEAERLRKYRAPGLLVIDEISRHAFFGQPQQHLYDMVAWREVQMRPTILTTNEAGDDLSTILGPALSSRAAGSDGVVHFGAKDWRVANKRRRIVA